MFYFIFNEPRQIKQFRVDSLSRFLQLISDGGELYTSFKNEFFHRPETVDRDNESGYKTIIAEKEEALKYEFARYISKDKQLEDINAIFEIFYRGVADVNYQTIPSAYRGNNQKYENRFINDIRVSNPDFVQGKTYIDELSALQHYWCPTRLLDLTRNPLVALYFACADVLEPNHKATDGAVLFFLAKEEDILHSNSDIVLILTALSHLSETHKQQLFGICDSEIRLNGKNAKLNGPKITTKTSVKKLYQEILRVTNFDKEILCMDLLQSFYVQPAYNNLRIRAQSGLFLINGLSGSIRECEMRNENKIFAKIIIPYANKRKILADLDQVGISNRTLFPEIEDTVKYLKNKYK